MPVESVGGPPRRCLRRNQVDNDSLLQLKRNERLAVNTTAVPLVIFNTPRSFLMLEPATIMSVQLQDGALFRGVADNRAVLWHQLPGPPSGLNACMYCYRNYRFAQTHSATIGVINCPRRPRALFSSVLFGPETADDEYSALTYVPRTCRVSLRNLILFLKLRCVFHALHRPRTDYEECGIQFALFVRIGERAFITPEMYGLTSRKFINAMYVLNLEKY